MKEVSSLCLVYNVDHPVLALPVVRMWRALKVAGGAHCVIVGYCACRESRTLRGCKRCMPAAVGLARALKKEGESDVALNELVEPGVLEELWEQIGEMGGSEIGGFCFKGVPVGRYALYLVITKFKILDAGHMSGEVLEMARHSAYRCCEAILGVERWAETHGVPKYCVVNDDLYGVNRSLCEFLEQKGSQRVAILGSPCLSRIGDEFRVTVGSLFDFPKKQTHYWNELEKQSRRLSEQAVGAVREFYEALFAAKRVHVYSKPLRDYGSSWKARLFSGEEPEGCRYVLAALGSEDERSATRVAGNLSSRRDDFLFVSQLDWVKYLLQHYGGRKDVRLIVRVHPRDFPNKREGRKSEHADLLEREIRAVPKNVAVNWPGDAISLYGLIPWMSLVLGNSSTVPLEASGLGLPIIFPKFDGVSYQAVSDWNPETEESYGEALEEAMKRGATMARVMKTWRWYGMRYSHTVVRLASEALLRGESGIYGKLKRFVPGRLFRMPGYQFLGERAFCEAALSGDVDGDRPDVVRRLLDGTVSSGEELGVIDEALAISRIPTGREEVSAVVNELRKLADIISPRAERSAETPPLVEWIRGLKADELPRDIDV